MTRREPVIVSHGRWIEVAITSFGYLHEVPDEQADITVDLRKQLRDPHVDPAFRQLTGHDRAVMERVLTTPGAEGLVDGITAAVVALLPAAYRAGRLVKVTVGCAGGRHRSVVVADAIAARIALAGHGAEVEHWHITEPVIDR